jgi:hypothetical protein
MFRQLVIIVTILIFVGNVESFAQGRGGHRGGGPGPQMRSPAGPPSAFNRPPAPPALGRLGYNHPRAVWPQPTYVVRQPYYGYPSYYSYPSYSAYVPYVSTPTIYAAPAYIAPPVVQIAPSITQRESELSYQVERLSRQIEELRQQQALSASIQQQPAPVPPPDTRPAVPTTLIFRDGRRMSIQNYAIVGQTLWVLDEQQSTKIPLSELDVEATRAENRGQGIRFPAPATR